MHTTEFGANAVFNRRSYKIYLLLVMQLEMRTDFVIVFVVLLPVISLQLKVSSNNPNIVVDSLIAMDDPRHWKWTKFANLQSEAKEEFVHVVDGGFIFTNLNQVQINCEAPYPVEWTVGNFEDVPVEYSFAIQMHTKRNGSLDLMSLNLWSYTAVLTLYLILPSVSRNYTCRGLNSNSNRQASTFVYLSVEGQSLLAEAGQTFEINANEKSVVNLFCRVTNLEEQFQVILQKLIEVEASNFTWSPVALNDSVKYDFIIGFSLIAQDLPDIVGEYRCVVNGTEISEDDAVYYKISNTPKKKSLEDSLSPRMEIKGTAVMTWDDNRKKSRSRSLTYACCSDSKDPPELVIVPCHNPAHCSYTNVSLFATEKHSNLIRRWGSLKRRSPTSNCSQALVYFPIFIVRCKGVGIDVFQTYHFAFKHPEITDLSNNGNFMRSFTHKEIEFVSASIPFQGKYETMIKMTYFKLNEVGPNGKMGTNQNRDLNTKDFMYTGVNVTFQCHYSTYVFASGGYWEVKWKSGDSKIFEGEGDSMRMGYPSGQSGILTLKMKLERELESIKCACSVLNNSEWKFRETKVSVKDPLKPSFTLNKEDVWWPLHSKNVTLICELIGNPMPTVTWKKDGRLILFEHSKLMRITTEAKNRKSILVVPEVSHEMHGEYSCATENVAGTEEKVFKVYVQAGDSTEFYGWVIFGSVIFLVITGGIVAVWKDGIGNLRGMISRRLC